LYLIFLASLWSTSAIESSSVVILKLVLPMTTPHCSNPIHIASTVLYSVQLKCQTRFLQFKHANQLSVFCFLSCMFRLVCNLAFSETFAIWYLQCRWSKFLLHPTLGTDCIHRFVMLAYYNDWTSVYHIKPASASQED
jgi:hypothetical protein